MTLSSTMKYKTIDEKTMEGETKAVRGTHGEISLVDRKYTTQAQSLRNWPKLTNFSIENILRKDFGRTIQKHTHNYQHFHIRHAVNKLRVEDIFRGKVLLESEGRKTRGSQPPSPVLRVKAKTLLSPKSEGEPKDSNRSGTPLLWPAWVYCTRYSDRPSSGPRTRKIRSRRKKDEKRPRTAFSAPQLQRLRQEFQVCNYLTEERRRSLAMELNLSESQIKNLVSKQACQNKESSRLQESFGDESDEPRTLQPFYYSIA